MTEIPEHLLKRSKARRSAMGLGGEGGDDAPAAESTAGAPAAVEAAPVAATAAVPAAAAPPPPPPPPPPPYIEAANNRKRIPYWAMPVIVLLPVWAVLYLNAVKVPPVNDDQLAVGEQVYAKCATCHGAAGQGGVGPQLAGGEVLKTWPDPKAMMEWIWLGGEGWTGSSAPTDYGNPDRPGGVHNTGTLAGAMPAFKGQLTADELAAVTRYIRESLSGAPDETDVITPELAQQAIDDADAGKLIYKGEKPDDARVKATNP